MESKIVVEYTSAEATAALQLYDIALRARGMEIGEVVIHLSNKLKQAVKASNGTGVPPPTKEKPDAKHRDK